MRSSGFDSLVLPTYYSQLGDRLQLLKPSWYETVESFTMADNNAPAVPETTIIVNLNAYVASITENSSGYPSFNLRLIPTYTNSQLRYYHIIGVILDADKVTIKN